MKCSESRTTSAAKRALAPALFALALALAPGRARAAAVAVLKPEATVKGPAILLGEVATVKGSGPDAEKLKQVELGPSPLPGYARSVGSDAVRVRLKQLGLSPALLAAGPALICRATRASQTLPADRLIETARQYLQDQVGAGDGSSGRTVVEPLSHPLALTLPVGAVELTAEPVGTSTFGANRQVAVRVTVDGAPANRVILSLRIRQYVMAAVVKTALNKGDSVTPESIAYEERDRTNLSPDAILEGEPLDDLQALQSVPAGSPLTHRNAAAPAAIRRGDTVTLQARTGGITVSTSGTAMEDGRIGGTIRVKNASSQKETRARVLDSKTVEVKL